MMTVTLSIIYKIYLTYENYFHKICIETNVVARTSDIAVFVVIPSPMNIHVSITNDIIPVPKPINLPGHKRPSKWFTTYLVAKIKI